MDTLQLKAFIAVADTESFSLAAETLHLTQPAVSKRIAGLEHSLDCKLLDRLGRALRLTEAGRVLLPRARKIIAELSDAHREIHNLSGHVQGTLRIATSHHIGLHHLPAILRHFTQHYPDVNLQLEFLDSDTAYEAVRQGDVELAVITLASKPTPGLSVSAQWNDPLAFVVAANHPLAQRKNVDLEQLCHYPAILPESTTETTQRIQTLMNSRQLELELAMPTNFLETIKMMVSIGLGWSALPTSIIDEQLTTLEFNDVSIARTLGCVTHDKRSLSNAGLAFLNALKKHQF